MAIGWSEKGRCIQELPLVNGEGCRRTQHGANLLLGSRCEDRVAVLDPEDSQSGIIENHRIQSLSDISRVNTPFYR